MTHAMQDCTTVRAAQAHVGCPPNHRRSRISKGQDKVLTNAMSRVVTAFSGVAWGTCDQDRHGCARNLAGDALHNCCPATPAVHHNFALKADSACIMHQVLGLWHCGQMHWFEYTTAVECQLQQLQHRIEAHVMMLQRVFLAWLFLAWLFLA